MKYITATILMIFWMIITLLIACTIIGLMVLTEIDWFKIPNKLLQIYERE